MTLLTLKWQQNKKFQNIFAFFNAKKFFDIHVVVVYHLTVKGSLPTGCALTQLGATHISARWGHWVQPLHQGFNIAESKHWAQPLMGCDGLTDWVNLRGQYVYRTCSTSRLRHPRLMDWKTIFNVQRNSWIFEKDI